MAVRLVAYDLHLEPSSDDYAGFMEVIHSYAYARLSESSYAIATTQSPTTIYNKLLPYIDGNDSVIVMTLSKPYYGQHDPDVIEWLDENM